MKSIIIVSYKEDQHALFLREKAKKKGLSVVIFDPSLYPINSEISLEYRDDKSLFFNVWGNKYLKQEKTKGIWWRRPNGLRKNKNPLEQYISSESEVVIRSLFEFLPDVNWISGPEQTRLACRKPVQLLVAKKIGFVIPKTCITNSPKRFKSFLGELGNRQLTMKPVGSALMRLSVNGDDDSRKNKVIFTKLISPELVLANISMIKNCPVIFQEAIKKDSDIRVTVVDNDVFSSEIILEDCNDPDNLDWRNYAGKRVYKRHTLPEKISKKCVQITKALGLRFGCIDLAFSKSDGYTFFEINPQGQWLPSELKLGYNISGSLIKSLTI